MNNIAFPELDAPPPVTTAIAPLSIKSTVLAQFTGTETALRALAEKYRAVAFDVSTPKGMGEAKAARHDLRENGRFLVERAEKKIKAEVNDLKATMSAEVDRLVAIVRPTEDAIDGQIKAREEAIAAEKAEAERKAAEAARIEAERRQRHEDGIATLAGYVAKASGKTAAQIMGGIDFVRKIEIDPGHWQEYAERAQQTLDATLTTLTGMHAAAVQAERDAAELAALRAEKAARDERERLERLEAQKIEDARIAALAEQRRQDAAAESARIAAEMRDREEERAARELAAAIQAAPVSTPEARAVAALQLAAEVDGHTAAHTQAEPEPAPLTMTLGAVCAWLGFTVTSAFMADVLKIQPFGRDKNAILYRQSQREQIRKALVAHLQGLAA